MKIPAPNLPAFGPPLTDPQAFAALAARVCAGEEDLRGAALERLAFSGAAFPGLALRGVRMTACRFAGCDFSGADWADVQCIDCDFSGCDWTRASLRRCAFTGCKAVGLTAADAAFTETSFADGKLEYSNFASSVFRKCMFSRCSMPYARFFACTLGAVCENCDWTQASVFQTPLAGLDLSSVRLDGLSADPGSLRGAQVSRSQAADLAHLFGLCVLPY